MTERGPTESRRRSTTPCPELIGQACDLPFVTHGSTGSKQLSCGRRAVDGHASEEEPLIAHCVSGLARTFTLPVTHRSFDANVLRAIGGRAALFVYLKTWERTSENERGDAGSGTQGREPRNYDPELVRALRYLRPQATLVVRSAREERALMTILSYNRTSKSITSVSTMSAAHDPTPLSPCR